MVGVFVFHLIVGVNVVGLVAAGRECDLGPQSSSLLGATRGVQCENHTGIYEHSM